MIRKALIVAGFCAAGFTAPSAEAVIYFTGPNNIDIPGLTGFQTTGALMDGLDVTATFLDGSTETVTWAATGGDAGGVTGTGWSLSVDGDTFTAPWNFDFAAGTQLQLVSLFLDGLNALTVFDRTEPNTGTAGSAQGRDWTCNSAGVCDDAVVTYDYQVSIGGALAVGDLWQTVLVEFGDSGPNDDWSFLQDTDNDIRRSVPTIPEPGTLALLGAGLAGVRFFRGRRRS